MGTHPIFESDFDCLAETSKSKSNERRFQSEGRRLGGRQAKGCFGRRGRVLVKVGVECKEEAVASVDRCPARCHSTQATEQDEQLGVVPEFCCRVRNQAQQTVPDGDDLCPTSSRSRHFI